MSEKMRLFPDTDSVQYWGAFFLKTNEVRERRRLTRKRCFGFFLAGHAAPRPGQGLQSSHYDRLITLFAAAVLSGLDTGPGPLGSPFELANRYSSNGRLVLSSSSTAHRRWGPAPVRHAGRRPSLIALWIAGEWSPAFPGKPVAVFLSSLSSSTRDLAAIIAFTFIGGNGASVPFCFR